MRVYLAEKRSQAEDLARVLGDAAFPARAGAIAVRDGYVGWAVGHLLALEQPAEIDERYARWRMEDLPIVPSAWRKRPVGDRAAHLARLCALLREADEIVVCTDAAREGELIAHEVLVHAGVLRTPALRLWVSALNADALRRGFAALKPLSATRALAYAGEVRQRGDYLEGLNLSRAVSLLAREAERRGPFSVGRVQTPALFLVVARERAIRSFVVQDHYALRAVVAGAERAVSLTMDHQPKPILLDRAAAGVLADRARGAQGALRVVVSRKRQGPPAPFELATLQREAGKRFGWSVKHTLDVAQTLYERHKAISYPRTDGTAFDPGEWPVALGALERLRALGGPLGRLVPPTATAICRDRVFSAKALEGKDHHALMPTAEAPAGLSGDEAALFDLVARRFVVQFLPDWEYEAVSAALDANGVPFVASGRTTLVEGWRVALPPLKRAGAGAAGEAEQDEEDAGEDRALPALRDGETVRVVEVDVRGRKTRPPGRYREGDLVAAMKSARIGTKATWAAVVETLKARVYVGLVKRRIAPTDRGESLVAWLETAWPELLSVERTAALEEALDAVAEGRARAPEVLGRLTERVREAIAALARAPALLVGDVAAPGWSFAAAEDGAWELRGELPAEGFDAASLAGDEVEVRRKDGGVRRVRIAEVVSVESISGGVRVRARPVPAAPREAPSGCWRFAAPRKARVASSQPRASTGKKARGARRARREWHAVAEFAPGSEPAPDRLVGGTIEVRTRAGALSRAMVREVLEARQLADRVVMRVRIAPFDG